MKPKFLNVNDTVIWRGAWGQEAPKPAKVEGIEIVPKGQKYGGKEVQRVEWEKVINSGTIIVTLDNGHWAYGDQLSPIETKENDTPIERVLKNLLSELSGIEEKELTRAEKNIKRKLTDALEHIEILKLTE